MVIFVNNICIPKFQYQIGIGHFIPKKLARLLVSDWWLKEVLVHYYKIAQ